MGLLSEAPGLRVTLTRHLSVCLSVEPYDPKCRYRARQQTVRNIVILHKLTVAQITK